MFYHRLILYFINNKRSLQTPLKRPKPNNRALVRNGQPGVRDPSVQDSEQAVELAIDVPQGVPQDGSYDRGIGDRQRRRLA